MGFFNWKNLGLMIYNKSCLESKIYAVVAQLAERIHGKNEVSGSIPDNGSKTRLFGWE